MLRFASQIVFFVFLLCVVYVTLRSRRFFFMPGVNIYRKEAPVIYWLLFLSLVGCAVGVLGRAGYLLYAGAHDLDPFERQGFFSMHDAWVHALTIATFLGLSYLLVEDRLLLHSGDCVAACSTQSRESEAASAVGGVRRIAFP